MPRLGVTPTPPPVSLRRAQATPEPTKPSVSTRKQKGRVNNTAATGTLHKRLTLQMAGIMAHLELHPNDALSRARVSKIQDLLSGR